MNFFRAGVYLFLVAMPTSSHAFLMHIGSTLQGLSRVISAKNFHVVQEGNLYRSAQPSAQNLRQLIRKYNLKTIINLRGKETQSTWWQDEYRVASEEGAQLIDIEMKTATLPNKEQVIALLDAYDTAPKPILIHSQSGSDRSGEAAALWKLYKENSTKEKALEQLAPHYGHFRSRFPAKQFFIHLWKGREWLEKKYDPLLYPQHMYVPSTRSYPGKNFHEVEEGKLYRSAQLTPEELNEIIESHHIKTVINVSGAQPEKLWWQIEKQLLEKHGVAFHNVSLSINNESEKKELRSLLQLYNTAAQPILIHCRDGADRTGEATALWKIYKEHASRKEALEQLTLKYRHFSVFHPAKRAFITNLGTSNTPPYANSSH